MTRNARPLPQMRGREHQLTQISTNLRSVTTTRRSTVLLMEAAPGAGKTRLLQEAVNLAGRNRFTVVNGVSSDADTDAQAVRTPGGPNVSSAIEAAQAWLRHAPEDVRAVVALDDLHLVAPPALVTLCDLIVACRARPILWLLAFTPDGYAVPYAPVKSTLGRLRSRLPVEAVGDLGPLSGEALAQLVADQAGAVPDPELLALAQSVDGTPGAVIELMRGLMEDGDLYVVDGASRLQPDATPSGAGVCLPAHVPRRFSALIEKDLRALSEPTVKALRLAAVLGSPFAPEDLLAMLGEAPVGLLSAVDEAVNRGLLVCGEHDLAFRTEPIWRVLLDSVPPPVRAMLRRQAAEMLLPRRGGIERAALQLVHIARPGNAEELRIIAEGSQRLLATDPSAAASLATRCMELVSGQAERVRLAKTAVEALTRAGELDRAVTLAKETIGETSTPATSTPTLAKDIAALRASNSTALLLLGNARMAHRAAHDALVEEDGFQHGEAVITHLAASCLTGDDSAAGRAREVLSAPDRHAPAVHAGALTFHAFGQWRDGRVGEAVGTLRRAVALDHGGGDVRFLAPRWVLALTLTRTDEYEEAAAVAQGSAPAAASETRTLAAAVPAVLQAPLHLAQGRLEEAEAAARAGIGTDGPHVPMLAPQAWLVLARVALRRGALTQAEDHLKTLDKDFPQPVSSPWWGARQLLGAQLAEAQRDSRAAADVLAEIGTHADALRLLILEDPAAAAWCVRCALAADRPDIARSVVRAAEHLRTRNMGVPSVSVAAMHARALAEGDADALATAVGLHRNPWAQAAAAEDHAGLLLDRGDQKRAVGELDRSMRAFGELGGERDAARVRARLRRLGVRRRHWTHVKRPVSGWESLTKTERKVAELVAAGLTNHQAAHHLYISPHTVGFHLRQIYRKLEIRSRTALVRLSP